MANHHLNVLFWLYKSRVNKQGLAPLYLRLTYRNQRKNIATGLSAPLSKWDAKKGQLKGVVDSAKQVNDYMLQTKSRLLELFNELLRDGDADLEILVDRFMNKEIDHHSLLELVDYHNKDFEARVGIDYAYSTFEKYDILKRKLQVFIPYAYKKKDIRLKDLTPKFLTDFDFYLKKNDKNLHNTATKYLKNLKKIINVGITVGWLKENPFVLVKASYKDVDRVYLSQNELDALEAKEFSMPRLNLVRDLFLFQCYTGLAYSDMAKLTTRNLSPGIDGSKWIITRRKKTDVRSAIPLLFQAEELINKYRTDDQKDNAPLLPVYSIQKFNAYLHEIAELCGIHKNLTSHVGRRTFATTIALANGIGLETISKILGHATTKITAQYAVVTDHKIGQDMAQLRQKLAKNKIARNK